MQTRSMPTCCPLYAGEDLHRIRFLPTAQNERHEYNRGKATLYPDPARPDTVEASHRDRASHACMATDAHELQLLRADLYLAVWIRLSRNPAVLCQKS